MTDGARPRADFDPVEASEAESDSGLGPAAWILQPGTVIADKYRVDRLLGRGGMGVVAAGQQLDLERPVAIKFLRPGLTGRDRITRRFAREGRAIAKMRSEHVVRVFDVGEYEGVPFIVMERLNGNDLADELARGRLSVALTVQYVLQACEAVAEAHSLGIVHRDLKPSNLFLAEGLGGRRSVKVLDFGISKWLRPTPELDAQLATGEGTFLGTPAYVSPEQLTRPDGVDERTDVWALGVVLYQCLSQRLPFEAGNIHRLSAQILTAEPKPLRRSLALPDGLEQVILRCLCKDEDQRCPNVLELARALGPFAPASALHLLDSIASLSNGASAGTKRVSALTPAEAHAQALQTTLSFSQMTEGAGSRALATVPTKRRRERWRAALLAVVGGFILLAAVLAQRKDEEPKSPTPEAPQAPIVVSGAEAEGAPRASAVAPPPAASADPEAPPPRTPARVARLKLTAGPATPSAIAPSPSPPVASVLPAGAPTEAKPADPPREPPAKPVVSHDIDPAQLYRR